MSMISEQIKRLREKADTFERSGSAVDGIVKELRHAADTIEELSAKLHNANMERSSAYYNNGWIPVSEGKYPEPYTDVLVYDNSDYFVAWWTGYRGRWDSFDSQFEGNTHIVAWMPLPLPYKASPTGAESEGGTQHEI